MTTPHETRVLNLIARVDLSAASLKKRQVIGLLKIFPSARRIRFESVCHCRRGKQLSFQLPHIVHGTHDFNGELREDCGFWCPYCGFSNAGARHIMRTSAKNEFARE